MNFNDYNPYSGYGEQQSAQYGGSEQTYNEGYGGYDEQQYAQDYGDQQYDASYEESLFYPSQSPFVAHPIDDYRSAGCPISAVSFESTDSKKSQSLLFVASHTSKQGGSAGDARRKKSTSRLDKTLHRGSRMTILYKDEEGLDTYYGNRSLYSSFVAHPEAPSTTLDKVHGALFGGGKPIYDVSSSDVTSRHTNRGIKARPASAFGPCYGPPAYVHNAHNLAMNIGNKHNERPEEKYCMGVSSIFQVATPHFGTGGRVCSISPHGIRVHTRGGMGMSDNSSLPGGLTCGTLSRENSHYVTAGSMSCTDSKPQNVHSIDIARDLQVISSMTLVAGARRPGSDVCVTDIAANFERNNAVVGCSDGTFRLLDAGRRNAEVAKAAAQIGGVAKVAVSGVSH